MTENTATPKDEQPPPDTGDEAKAPPKPSDEDVERSKKKMAEIDAKYEPGARQTVVVPGSNGMVSGTAFDGLVENDEEWDGNRKDDKTRDR
ncbi:hypothetical protein [Aldersonia kunmingensis]|uniref:hypothetical protein n=1 Tax=Aldersonia kunmingensis TaxID=408066 RepID=UPI000831F5A4|nr:hypothetical protein [Aldersonia kunmingensis]